MVHVGRAYVCGVCMYRVRYQVTIVGYSNMESELL